MKENSGSKYPSKISVESMRSRNSNSVSLGRPSWGHRDPSLNKKVSLVYVMSIESDRKSDIYYDLLEENLGDRNRVIQFPPNRNSFGTSNDYNYHNFGYQQEKRGSYEQRPVLHSCQCYQECLLQKCPCFTARNQICLKDSCCQTCIQMKNALMLADRGEFCTCKNTQCLKSYCKCFQNNGVCTDKCRCQDCKNKIDSPQRALAYEAAINTNGNIQQFRKHCTCKKTKCNKKYCSCYAMNMKCTKDCQCQNCHNCDRKFHEMEEESPPEFIGEQDLQNMEFPERMSFQQPEFTKY